MDSINAPSTRPTTTIPERIVWVVSSGAKATAAAKPRAAVKPSSEANVGSRARVAPPSRGVSKPLSRSARRRRAKQMTKKVVDISDMLLGMNI